MNDNELIRRGDVRAEIKRLTFNPLVNELLYRVLDGISPVPHEMTARKFVSNISRMCKYRQEKGKHICDDCWFNQFDGEWGRVISRLDEKDVEAVEKWVKEHPETAEQEVSE